MTKKSHKEKIVLAFFIGAVVSIILALFGFEILAHNVRIIFGSFVVISIIIAILSFLIIWNKEKISKYIFGIEDGSKDQVIKSITNSIIQIKEGKFDNLENEISESVTHIGSWYSWWKFRNWVVVVFYTLCLGYAGILGSVLFYNQNKLLKSQNEVINVQTDLLSIQNERVKQQTYLMDSEMKRPSEKEIEQANQIIQRVVEKNKVDLIDVADLSNVLFSFKPYRYMDEKADLLNDKSYSPEKSKVLLDLIINIKDQNSWNLIKSSIDFNHIDISNLIFPDNSDLSSFKIMGSKFRRSTFKKANFKDAYLNATNFENSNLEGANFETTFSPNCNFNKTNLYYTSFKSAVLNNSTFVEADLYHTVFDSSSVTSCDFTKSDIYDISAKGAIFNYSKALTSQRMSLKLSGLTEEQLNQFEWIDDKQD